MKEYLSSRESCCRAEICISRAEHSDRRPSLSQVTVQMILTSFFFLVLPLAQVGSDPASELAEMEEIMMSLFPFNSVLNPRVGRGELAARSQSVTCWTYSRFLVANSHSSHSSRSSVSLSLTQSVITSCDIH